MNTYPINDVDLDRIGADLSRIVDIIHALPVWAFDGNDTRMLDAVADIGHVLRAVRLRVEGRR